MPETDPKFVPNPTRLESALSAVAEPAVYPTADPAFAADKLPSEEDALREYAAEAMRSKAAAQDLERLPRSWGSLFLILWIGGLTAFGVIRQIRCKN